MLLADLGADVVRVERPSSAGRTDPDPMLGLLRNRRSMALDLRTDLGRDVAIRMVARADVLIEGHRPGVMERLDLGPEVCLTRNPRLVYARMTGWGQTGPLADRAGHDINFIAVTGALHATGHADRPPPPPLNLVADFGAGGTFLALGVLAALLERESSGRGQVLDVAMTDGVATMMGFFQGLHAIGEWSTQRGSNVLDGSAPYYRAYATQDGQYVAVGAIEPPFYAQLLTRLDLDPASYPQEDRSHWPQLTEELERRFLSRPRAYWEQLFDGSDACVSPVLTWDEAADHPQLRARNVYTEDFGVHQPSPAPRFSRTPGAIRSGPPLPGQHTDELLEEHGYSADQVAALRAAGAVA